MRGHAAMPYRRIINVYLRKIGVENPWSIPDEQRIKLCATALVIEEPRYKRKRDKDEALKKLSIAIANRAVDDLPKFSTWAPNVVWRQPTKQAPKPLVEGVSKWGSRQAFYDSDQWRAVRYDTLKRSEGCCCLCGNKPQRGKPLHVDHIKPRSTHPELELSINNLQVLCADCNLGKSNRDQTDWRDNVVKLTRV